MGPNIRFCKDSAGRRLAFAVDGEGPPLVFPGWWVSHLERDWDEPRFRRFFSALAEQYTVIRYDRAGMGLSDRDRSDFTLERDTADLIALLEQLQFDQVSLAGPSCGGPIAIGCAVRHPERIAKLLLYGSYACGQDIWDVGLKDAMLALVRAHWGVGAKAIADIFAPDLSRDESRRLARVQREATSAATAAQLLDLTYRMDVRPLLTQVSVPTLVIHRRDETAIPVECGRDLAANIPGASLVLLKGNAHAPWFGDSRAVIDVMVDFLGPGALASPPGAVIAQAESSGANVWHRSGDVWTIRFGGEEIHLKHKKGLSDLAALLSSPRQPIHALELVQGSANGAAYRPSPQPVLDEQARREYRERVRLLQEELAQAESDHDLGRMQRLRAELEVVSGELVCATGLSGRPRSLDDPAERARKAVAARIRDSIAAVEAACPRLGAHLREAVGTGAQCVYAPESDVCWRT